MFVDLALAPRILCSVVFTVNTRLQGAPPPHVELNTKHLYAVNYIKMNRDPLCVCPGYIPDTDGRVYCQ